MSGAHLLLQLGTEYSWPQLGALMLKTGGLGWKYLDAQSITAEMVGHLWEGVCSL